MHYSELVSRLFDCEIRPCGILGNRANVRHGVSARLLAEPYAAQSQNSPPLCLCNASLWNLTSCCDTDFLLTQRILKSKVAQSKIKKQSYMLVRHLKVIDPLIDVFRCPTKTA